MTFVDYANKYSCMSKINYICQSCEYETAKWLGKCPSCNSWNSFESFEVEKKTKMKKSCLKISSQKPELLDSIELQSIRRFKTGVNEFDRVLGGGIYPGGLILIGGEPGIGKTTLLTNILSQLSSREEFRTLYVSGEESKQQVASRARRLGVNGRNFFIYNETSWQSIEEEIDALNPKILVIDSIHTIMSQEVQSAAGSIAQIREVTYELMNKIKSKKISCFVIGHITKDGNIAGPKVLEHMVDTSIYFEGDQLGHYRMLRAIKNRFGSTDEVGIFEMTENGLKEVQNPSVYFLDESIQESFGRALSCIIEGSRVIIVEMQALVVENKLGSLRRVTQGIDVNRLAMLVAIIEKYFDIAISYNDIYFNLVGGIKVTNRDIDLGLIAALLSSFYKRKISSKTIFIGEVGLTGEVRSISQCDKKIRELEFLKYDKIITSERLAEKFSGKTSLKVVGIKNASELLYTCFEQAC